MLTIVIPFKDEEDRLAGTVSDVLSYASAHIPEFEVILVDDGSTDACVKTVRDALRDPRIRLLRHKKNLGKGAAVRTGIRTARGARILFSDADLATPIHEIAGLARAVEAGADIAIASRAIPGARILARQPFYREWTGKLGNVFIRIMTGLPYRDTQCGFKLFTARAAQRLFAEQSFPGWSFDVELLVKAASAGFRVAEVPVAWRDAPGSKFRPLRDALRVFRDVIAIRKKYGRVRPRAETKTMRRRSTSTSNVKGGEGGSDEKRAND